MHYLIKAWMLSSFHSLHTGVALAVLLFLLSLWAQTAAGQCADNEVINPGFEEVGPPCGPVPPGGLINGSFNMGCMTGWEAAWGTPSVCAFGPNSGDYYCCLGANNEAVHQNLNLCAGGLYELSFAYRRISGTSGFLRVYLASGLVNQPMSNTGNPPLMAQGSWQVLADLPINNNNWQQFVLPEFTVSNPANNQLLFLLVPAVDIGFDDIVLRTVGRDPVIACSSSTPGTYSFTGSVPNPPNGYTITAWNWDFGDGNTGSGPTVTHTFASQGTYNVCLTTVDQCGCTREACITVEYNNCSCGCGQDQDDPVILTTVDPVIQVSCLSEVPPPPVLVVQDACDEAPNIELTETLSGAVCNQTMSRTWVVSDRCGRSVSLSQVIQIVDTDPPVFLSDPQNPVVFCPDQLEAFADWVEAYGNAVAVDGCFPVQWTVAYDSLPESPCGGIQVLFTASDTCGNSASRIGVFLSEDNQPPTIVAFPSDLSVFCQADIADTLQGWLEAYAGGVAEDACGGVSWSYAVQGDTSASIIPVLFTVTDDCGNSLALPAFFIRSGGEDTLFVQQFTCDPLAVGVDTQSVVLAECTVLRITETSLLLPDTVWISTFTCSPQEAGTDTLLLINQAGCDSLVIRVRTLLPGDTTLIQGFTCDPQLAGADTLVLSNQLGCDSLLITLTTWLAADSIVLQVSTCDSTQAGNQVFLFQNQAGCDSVVWVETIWVPAYVQVDELIICGEGTSYADTLLVTDGLCDSLFVTFYRFQAPDTTLLQAGNCDPGQVGELVVVYEGSQGCDSVVITQYLAWPSDTLELTTSTCDSQQAGTTEWIGVNQFGCDSIVRITAVLVAVDTQFVFQTTCIQSEAGVVVAVVPGPDCDTIRVTATQWIPPQIQRDTLDLCGTGMTATDTLVLVGVDGCDSLQIRLTRYFSLELSAQVADESCAGLADGRLVLVPGGDGLAPFTYQLNGGAAQNAPVFDGLPPGSYTLYTEDARGCRDTLSNLLISPGPALMLDAGPDQLVTRGSLVALQVTASPPAASLLWQATDPLTCNTCTALQLGPVSVEQWVTVTGVLGGCTAQDALLIRVREASRWYIPTAFSPNGDGINDVFRVFAGDSPLFLRSMAIYDRWGNALWRQEAIWSDDALAAWDGTFREQPMDPGVFVYAIELETEGGLIRVIKGEVTLVR